MRLALVSLVAATLPAMALAQSPAASQTTGPAAKAPSGQTAGGAAIVAELARSVDAKKAKANDKIEARVTMDVLAHGEIAIPRGTKIIGHVTEAKARTKQVPESMVEIAFDRLVLKNGHEVPLKAMIQAVAAPMQTSLDGEAVNEAIGSELAGEISSRPAPGPNELHHTASTAFPGSIRPSNAGSGADASTGSGGSGRSLGPALGPTRQGVVGMKGIALSNRAQGSVISSNSENVHLRTGTQLVLRISEPQVLAESLRRSKN